MKLKHHGGILQQNAPQEKNYIMELKMSESSLREFQQDQFKHYMLQILTIYNGSQMYHTITDLLIFLVCTVWD